MVVCFPANVCAVFEILVMLFQVCGVMGLCLNRLTPRLDALVVTRTDWRHHRSFWPRHRRCPVRPS